MRRPLVCVCTDPPVMGVWSGCGVDRSASAASLGRRGCSSRCLAKGGVGGRCQAFTGTVTAKSRAAVQAEDLVRRTLADPELVDKHAPVRVVLVVAYLGGEEGHVARVVQRNPRRLVGEFAVDGGPASCSRYYIHHGETAAEFDVLARTAKHLMNWVMRELGPVLTALPVGPSYPGRAVGPTFDIARPAIFMLPHQDAAWKIIKERLDALEQACTSLGQQAGLGALAPLADKLHSMGQDIAAHGPRTAA